MIKAKNEIKICLKILKSIKTFEEFDEPSCEQVLREFERFQKSSSLLNFGVIQKFIKSKTWHRPKSVQPVAQVD